MSTGETYVEDVSSNQTERHTLDFLPKREAGTDAVSFPVVITSLERMAGGCASAVQVRDVQRVGSAVRFVILFGAENADAHRV